MAMMGRFIGQERTGGRGRHGTPVGRAERERERGIDLAPLVTYQLSPDERIRYGMDPAPSSEEGDAEMRSLSQAQDAAVIEALREGKSQMRVARDTGVSLNAVKRRAAALAAAEGGSEEGDGMPGVTEVGERVERMIREGADPASIKREAQVRQATLTAAAERLGVMWAGDAWESVTAKAPESPAEDPAPGAALEAETPDAPTVATDRGYEQAPGAPVPDSEKAQIDPAAALRIAIDEDIDAGIAPRDIAKQEHCTETQVLDRALERGMHWTFGRVWLTTDNLRAAIDRIAEVPAQPETPQGAEKTETNFQRGYAAGFDDGKVQAVIDAPKRDARIREEGWQAGYAQGHADGRKAHAAFTPPRDDALSALDERLTRMESRFPSPMEQAEIRSLRAFLVQTLRLAERVPTYEADVETEQMAREVADRAAEELAR